MRAREREIEKRNNTDQNNDSTLYIWIKLFAVQLTTSFLSRVRVGGGGRLNEYVCVPVKARTSQRKREKSVP